MNTITLDSPPEFCLVFECPSCEKRIPYEGVEAGVVVVDTFACVWCHTQIQFRAMVALDFEITATLPEDK